MNQYDLTGRRAVITGGASGIGFATAQRFLQSGARVDIWDLRQDKVDEACATLRAFGSVSGRVVDVSKLPSVQAGARSALTELEQVDILVNNAGTIDVATVLETTPEIWRRNIAVNLDSVFFCSQTFAPGMISRTWGRVINVASNAGKTGNPTQSAYCAAKAGVIAFTKSFAKEIATTGVTVNAIAPSLLATPLALESMNANPQDYKPIIDSIPMQRMGRPEDAAAMMAWIASDDCAFTTGFTFDLSGGRSTY